MPWLGASERRTFRGITVAYTWPGKWRLTSSATVIPRNVRLSEAPSHGMPVLDYDSLSRGAEAYRSLAEEIAAKHTASN